MSDEPPLPPELEPAQALFDRGDFRGATAALRALLAAPPSPEVEQAARALQARMVPDPWALRIGVLTAALLVLVTVLYIR